MRRVLLAVLVVVGYLSVVSAEVPEHEPSLDGTCGEGFQYSRGTASCKQADCPTGAGRTYTYNCNCGEAWDQPFRTCYDSQQPGLAVSCVAAGTPCPGDILPPSTTPNVSSVPSTGTSGGSELPLPPGESSGPGVTVVNPDIFGPLLTPSEIGRLPCNDSRRVKHDVDILTSDYASQVKVNPHTYVLFLFGGVRGVVNNIASAVTGGWAGGEYVCGAYQGKVLDFFEKYRAKDSQLMECVDFGPIQAKGGMHQAVVLYPRGKDWLSTGLVFDPWYTQAHAVYTIKSWNILALGSAAPSQYYSDFPLYGNGYETTRESYGPEEKAVLAYLNDPQAQNDARVQALAAEYRGLATLAEKKRWLLQHRNIIAGHSPGNYALTDAFGRQSGVLPDGSVVDDIPGVQFLQYGLDDGTRAIYFEVPSFAELQLDFTADQDGETTVFLATVTPGANGKMYYYTTPVASGDTASLRLPDSGSGESAPELAVGDTAIPPQEIPASQIQEEDNPYQGRASCCVGFLLLAGLAASGLAISGRSSPPGPLAPGD